MTKKIFTIVLLVLSTEACYGKDFEQKEEQQKIERNLNYFTQQLVQLNEEIWEKNNPELRTQFWHAYDKNLKTGDPSKYGPETFNEIPQIEAFIEKSWPKDLKEKKNLRYSTKKLTIPQQAYVMTQQLRDIIETYAIALQQKHAGIDQTRKNLNSLAEQITKEQEAIKKATFTSKTYRMPHELLLALIQAINTDMGQALQIANLFYPQNQKADVGRYIGMPR